jgi:hypothetical protein
MALAGVGKIVPVRRNISAVGEGRRPSASRISFSVTLGVL